MPKIKGILAIAIVLIIVGSSMTIYYSIYNSQSVVKKLGPGLELSIMPFQGQPHNNTTAQLINASVQLYMNNPPTVTQGVQTFTNVTPLFNGVVNSTGNITTNISASFYSLAENWTLYFMETNNTGANTSLTMLVSYLYKNGSYYYVYFNTVVISIDPAFFIFPVGIFQKVTSIEGYRHLYSLKINFHPSLSSLRGYRVQYINPMNIARVNSSNIVSNSVNDSQYVYPMGIAGGSGRYMWVLKKQSTFNNYPIPLAWANNSILQNNDEEIDIAVTLGSYSQATYFHPGECSYINGTYSWSTLNGSSYVSPKVAGTVAYNALPVNDNPPHGVMLYVVGTITVDYYQLYQNTVSGWLPTNNKYTITEFASLNITNNQFQMGYMNLTWGSIWSLLEPENLVTHLFTSSNYKIAYYNMTNGESVQWGTFEDSISSSATDIWPYINSIIGLGLSTISVIALADGWLPGSGWLDLADDIATIVGMASAIYGVVSSQVTSFNTNVYLFSGSISLENPVGTPNNLELKVITNNAPLTIITSNNGTTTTGEFNIPVYDISAVSQ